MAWGLLYSVVTSPSVNACWGVSRSSSSGLVSKDAVAASSADGRIEAFWDAARAETCDRMTLFHKIWRAPSTVTYVSGRSLVPSTSTNYAAFAAWVLVVECWPNF